MNAFGYVRLSKWGDNTTSPQRQRAAIAKLCKQRGWKLVEVFEDIDVSAYNGNHRPAFERMMSRLSEAGAIVFPTLDRLSRSTAQAGRIAEACRAAGVHMVATDMPIDTTSAGGKFVYDVLAAKGEMESSTISERSRAMVAWKKEQGEPLGRVPFGWRRSGKHFEKDPRQQATLEKAARRYVAGESFNAIAKSLGMQTAPLSRMLHSQRVHDALPENVAGALAQALVARKRERVPTSMRSLLGGIATCGECGGTMSTTSTRGGRSGRWFSYGCRTAGHVHISAPWLDEFVTSQVLEAVDSGELVKALKRRKPISRTRKASQVEARMALLDEQFTSGKVTAERFKRMNAALVEELGNATKVERENGHDLPEELARDLSKSWPALTVGERRRVIQAVVSEIRVTKAQSNGPVDPSRVRIVWR